MTQSAAIVSLGCPKNTVESENMLGVLKNGGFNIVNDISAADIIIIHTCSFIKAARDESERCIKKALAVKNKRNSKVFVTGCLPQFLKDEILKLFPKVDGYLGTGGLNNISDLISNKTESAICEAGGLNEYKTRILSSPLPYAYLKIAEGCDHRCSFCIIPELRGKYKSRNIVSIVEEARALAQAGVKELIIIAQDTTSFGVDVYGSFALGKLLSKLAEIKEFKWLRLMYAYPSSVNEELLEVMKEYQNICSYIDMPVQHISKKVLSAMKRPLNAAFAVKKIKSKIPDIVLRTSLITGFPGETDKDVKELINFIKDGWFGYAGVFEYCDNEKASSYKLKNKVMPEIAKERKILIENAQYEVFKSQISKMKNAQTQILAENCIKDGDFYKITGRTYFQSPEIDGNTILKSANPLKTGEFYNVKIKGNRGYNITAQQYAPFKAVRSEYR
ncbi:MAG: 30S ribosomal protein S12 methylthiotransferase RimO [Endomicrobium sp.]|jgi:ribosomal protein S12 methylthiotransferase|nr:30S ribosomal protein S12 methylthiotransferase RimO [Endomicrobium sp.]